MIYHFCAMHQLENLTIQYADGIIGFDGDIKVAPGYETLKEEIRKFMGVKGNVIITSLSIVEVK